MINNFKDPQFGLIKVPTRIDQVKQYIRRLNGIGKVNLGVIKYFISKYYSLLLQQSAELATIFILDNDHYYIVYNDTYQGELIESIIPKDKIVEFEDIQLIVYQHNHNDDDFLDPGGSTC